MTMLKIQTQVMAPRPRLRRNLIVVPFSECYPGELADLVFAANPVIFAEIDAQAPLVKEAALDSVVFVDKIDDDRTDDGAEKEHAVAEPVAIGQEGQIEKRADKRTADNRSKNSGTVACSDKHTGEDAKAGKQNHANDVHINFLFFEF
jgi:hypothetical protein